MHLKHAPANSATTANIKLVQTSSHTYLKPVRVRAEAMSGIDNPLGLDPKVRGNVFRTPEALINAWTAIPPFAESLDHTSPTLRAKSASRRPPASDYIRVIRSALNLDVGPVACGLNYVAARQEFLLLEEMVRRGFMKYTRTVLDYRRYHVTQQGADMVGLKAPTRKCCRIRQS